MADNDMPSVVEFSEDISTAEAPPPIPKMDYVAQIRDANITLSSKGTRYAAVTFYIAPDQLPADFPAEIYPDGVTIVYRRVSLEDNNNSRYRLRKFCEAIGAPAAKRIDVSEWIGREALVSVNHETYEGQDRHVIQTVKSAD
jgi:hypothetical protein